MGARFEILKIVLMKPIIGYKFKSKLHKKKILRTVGYSTLIYCYLLIDREKIFYPILT